MNKIISFSLYGNEPNFQVGAVVNVLEAKRLYPDWKCRFYTTDDEGICKQLEYLGAEIVRMDDWPEGNMFWRFLAVDDADVCLSRDTDSVVNERELGAVQQWLDTDKQWHLMHDHRNHGRHIMGGMWGFKKGGPTEFASKTMRQCIEEWVALNGNSSEGYGRDQDFLRDVVVQMTKDNVLKHGNFGAPFVEHAPCRYGRFVGDYSFRITGWGGFVNGDKKSTFVSAPEMRYDRVLDRAILSCDSHPDYIDFWPLSAAAWDRIGVKPTLIIVERPGENIRVDESIGDVVRLELQDESIHTAFAAQAVRLLAPSLYPDENITIADIDIIPLNKEYFFKNLCRGPEDSFIEYRHGCVGTDQVAMCWNVAKGSVWGDVLGVSATMEDYGGIFLDKLKIWNPKNYKPVSEGVCHEWFTDQKLLYKYLSEWGGQHIKLTDAMCGHRRLDHRVKKAPKMHDYFTDFCPRRPVKHNLDYRGRPDLDNIDSIKHVFDWYKIPWSYHE